MKYHSALILALLLALSGCGGSSSSSSTPPVEDDIVDNGGGDNGDQGGTPPLPAGRTFIIETGPNATAEMLSAMIGARPGDTIEFGKGYFELTAGIQIASTENILVKGQGMNETILSFKNSSSQEGFLATTVRGITVQDLTVLDPPGDAFKLQGVDHGTLRRVRAFWSSGRKLENEDTVTAANYREKLQVACTDPARHNPNNPNPSETDTTSPDYTVSIKSGRYGIYPVNSQNILVDGAESIGASDAGIYVGQTDNAIIRNSRAAFNVFGFEIENVRGGEYVDNLSECNTGGFLVYDLDGLTRYGSRTRMYRNHARNNNTYNFAEPGSLVANIPRGTGMLTLGYDKIDIFENTFENHGTAGIVHTSYKLLGAPGDRRLDMYSEGVHIFNNTFINNGNDVPQPDFATIAATEGEQVTSAFPMLVGLKVAAATGEYRGAHIAWDGYQDSYDADCPYPVDEQGQPIPADEDGKPISGNHYPNPDCRYNGYKFDNAGERKKPLWWFSCIDDDNTFADDSLTYANFHGLEGMNLLVYGAPSSLDELIAGAQAIEDFAADTDITPHKCVDQYGGNMALLPPVVIPEFVPSVVFDPEPTATEIDALCSASVADGEINAAAYTVNCPRLDQYHLFSDPEDPRSLPNGRGVPFVLNSKLFSDYSTKYRVAYIPEGEQAIYRDGQDGNNATILFPVGTILSKSFAFADETTNTETVVETRLLIKRESSSGQVFWDGLEYRWQEENGQRVAVLAQEGGSASVAWNYHDVDSDEHYVGASDDYSLPNANQCLSCHANDDAETGAAPIGPKVRNLNRPFASESPIASGIDLHPINGENQLLYWCQTGLMGNCPDNLQLDPTTSYITNLERNPKFNIAGDSGFAANSNEDIEARVRSYLEVNCAHCHNRRGLAQNTGFYMDVFRPVNDTYGICKGPTASGTEGRGGREYDIVPGSAADSILPYRIGPEATTIAAKMPPLARGQVHTTAFNLVSRWINDVVDNSYDNADACNTSNGGDNGGGIPELPSCAPGEVPGIGGECLPL
ncbi:hypothetical protein HCU74_11655 [Spongiibacter sp. KMU-166]|uniref:Cytochrome c domain-containing protein n=1 Tax=Spongiibacter thalassae TaxID=2721624 RepID=A0ABX1GFS9_9GAMM|nr:parallel beta-helix domain-containing protein [Spongiibacter thalassae]NKI18059.1 hypothetical protein [Spongiibacter thalassae]